jgi:hypothetical protein
MNIFEPYSLGNLRLHDTFYTGGETGYIDYPSVG